MKIAVQTNRRSHSQLELEFKSIHSSGYEAVPFGYITTDKQTIKIVGLEHLDKDEKIYSRCSTLFLDKDINITGEYPDYLLKSICYNEDSFSISNMPESDVFVNKTPDTYKITELKNVLYEKVTETTFYKPDNDRKFIPGTLVKEGYSLADALSKDYSLLYNEDELKTSILCSKRIIHNIDEEVRCYIVNGKCVTLSRYRKNDAYDISDLDKDESILYSRTAEYYLAHYYSPALMCTIDLFKSNGKIYIMEYNCLNSSGLYNADSRKLFKSIENFI